MANWNWAMTTMMPPFRGENVRITNTYEDHLARSAKRRRSGDGGVDISYPSPKGGGPVYSPIAGIVEVVGNSAYNTTTIVDASGTRHRFLHMAAVTVKTGQRVSAGTQIGFEGGFGPKRGNRCPNGPCNDSYDKHLHYDITPSSGAGRKVDPVAWWNGDRDPGKVVSPTSVSAEDFAKQENIETGGAPLPSDGPAPPPVGNASEYAPRRAEPSQVSNVGLAVWTNRVPSHEPWPRVMLTDKTTNEPTETVEYNVNHEPQIADDGTEETSGKIGRLDGMVTYVRNKFWRR